MKEGFTNKNTLHKSRRNLESSHKNEHREHYQKPSGAINMSISIMHHEKYVFIYIKSTDPGNQKTNLAAV
jgi:hypothetical protein